MNLMVEVRRHKDYETKKEYGVRKITLTDWGLKVTNEIYFASMGKKYDMMNAETSGSGTWLPFVGYTQKIEKVPNFLKIEDKK